VFTVNRITADRKKGLRRSVIHMRWTVYPVDRNRSLRSGVINSVERKRYMVDRISFL